MSTDSSVYIYINRIGINLLQLLIKLLSRYSILYTWFSGGMQGVELIIYRAAYQYCEPIRKTWTTTTIQAKDAILIYKLLTDVVIK